MMAEPRLDRDDFFTLLEELYEQAACHDSLRRLRARGWERFCELGLPSRRHEQFRYIKLRHLFSQNSLLLAKPSPVAFNLEDSLLPEAEGYAVVLVNGFFSKELSNLPPKILISDLEEANRTFNAFLTNQWNQSLKEETDPFVALNGALHSGGLFLYLPPKLEIAAPLQIINLITSPEKQLVMPRIQGYFGANSRASVVITTVVDEQVAPVCNQVCELTVEENAQVQLIQTVEGAISDGWLFDALRATLKRNSRLQVVNYNEGAFTLRNDYRVLLTGEGGEVSLNGAWMADKKRESHCNILIDHQAPHCLSNQLFKGVLTDFARSSFEGKIYVRREAQKTQAYQLNNNLLLSDRANADSKPNLEIFADDVKASHGATVGQLDEEQLFYLRTRGYSKDRARNALVFAFVKEVLDQISISSLNQQLSRRVELFLA